MTSRTTRRRGAKPTAGKPTAGKPTAEKPTAEKPTAEKPTAGKPTAGKGRPTPKRGARNRRSGLSWPRVVLVAVIVVALGGLYLVYRAATHTNAGSKGGSGFPYAVGQPGPGAQAPTFSLDATTGAKLSLASLHGKGVLLYFQEGLSCQPCWDQIADLEKHQAELKAAGVDQVVSITSDPVGLLTQRVHDMGLSTTVLSDPDLAVSKTYHANEYGMMGTSRDGHTFILVKPDGSIAWRGDYGGAPKYTMYVPTTGVLADLRAAAGSSAGATP